VPALEEYRKKRNFRRTPEPRGKGAPSPRTRAPRTRRKGLRFVVQKHSASRLHYDLRLELDGVLKSWAVPKGPSLVPGERRLAVEVEDHPLEYGEFEGTIPKGEYGGGSVLLWDRGVWSSQENPRDGLNQGRLKFELDGEKLHGSWMLVRVKFGEGGKPSWLLIKERDRFARDGTSKSVVDARPESVVTGRTIEEIASGGKAEREWSSSVRERSSVPPKPTRKGPPKRDPGRKAPVKEPPPEDPPKPPVREPPDEAREESAFLGVRVTHPELTPQAPV
jgi:bifunctional non-homologous end joining protein LigD